LPDASMRERIILATLAVVILFMGIASPLFTRRMEPTTDEVLKRIEQRMQRPQVAGAPALASPSKHHDAVLPAIPAASLNEISATRMAH
jgi:hypothetical protein